MPGGTAGGSNGITGGDWNNDGIRRYYTGGCIVVDTKSVANKKGGESSDTNIMSLGSFDVDVGMMDGVELSPDKKKKKVKEEETNNDIVGEVAMFSIDDDDDESTAGDDNDETDNAMEDVALGSTPVDDDDDDDTDANNSVHMPTNLTMVTGGDNTSGTNQFRFSPTSSDQMTTFESLYHLSPQMTWRLRSAYTPQSSQERMMNPELLTQRAPSGRQADGMLRGLQVAKNCEARVCDGLRKLGELISYCERLKGNNKKNKKESGMFHDKWNNMAGNVPTQDEDDQSSSEDEEDNPELETAESMFAYFCEKNCLPMLIDALLCHPPSITTSSSSLTDRASSSDNTTTTIGSSPSPFSGVTWTAAVKSQILQTIAMILFNTSSPLSLTFLLSNNYMNELIMGIMPLNQWKDDALEEILPPYITLLRGLVMKLRDEGFGKCCLPLFLCQRQMRLGHNNAAAVVVAQDEDMNNETYMPLLYAAVQVFCSPYGTSLRDSEGSLIRTTAMNVILNLARITDPEVRMVLVQGSTGTEAEGVMSSLPATKSAPSTSPSALSHPLTIEQELLFPHICSAMK